MLASIISHLPRSISVLLSAAIFTTWFLSILTGNYSQVDRIWSIIPVVYVFAFTIASGFTARLCLISLLVLFWGTRLTYNFARKGGYRWKDEDYRWPALRKAMNPVLYQIFNVAFISVYQNVLLLQITLPAFVAMENRTDLNWLDGLASVTFLSFLLLETLADEAQWKFYSEKYRRIAKGEKLTGDYADGFNQSGLFKYSRHPNFFAEQGIWWSLCLFSVASTWSFGCAWSWIGALQLSFLFQGSTMFTEQITLSKYPKYAHYQKRTSRLVPWFARGKRE